MLFVKRNCGEKCFVIFIPIIYSFMIASTYCQVKKFLFYYFNLFVNVSVKFIYNINYIFTVFQNFSAIINIRVHYILNYNNMKLFCNLKLQKRTL